MSIKTALSRYYEYVDERDSKADPEAAFIAILLIHHLIDYDEALKDANESYAKASVKDIEEIVAKLKKEDWERIDNLFSSWDYRNRFRDDIDLLLKNVI